VEGVMKHLLIFYNRVNVMPSAIGVCDSVTHSMRSHRYRMSQPLGVHQSFERPDAAIIFCLHRLRPSSIPKTP
jgi:hypothetical protein